MCVCSVCVNRINGTENDRIAFFGMLESRRTELLNPPKLFNSQRLFDGRV